MALGTGSGGVRAGQSEPCTGVTPIGCTPAGGVMALLTRLREVRLQVAWSGCALIVREMARYARSIRDIEVVRAMALRTGQRGMRAG